MSASVKISEAVTACNEWARTYYRNPAQRPTGAADQIRYALIDLLQVVSPDMLVSEIRAEHLISLQELLIKRGLSRTTINYRRAKILIFLRFCAKPPRRWISTVDIEDCKLAEPLKAGRSNAAEYQPVRPIDWQTVAATMAACPLWLATAIELLWLTGMRPSELQRMRRSELESRGPVMLYKPAEHKTDRWTQRIIVLGPQAKHLLQQFMRRIPACQDRIFPLRNRQAIYNAMRWHCHRAGIPMWSPYRLRHAYASRVVRQAGTLAAQQGLGHTSPKLLRTYVEPSMEAAMTAMLAIG